MKNFIDINDVKQSAIKISFCFNGHNIDFDDITKKMSIEPSRVRHEDNFPEVSKKTGVARDIWELNSGYNESRLVADEFEKFLAMNDLWEKIDIINELKFVHNMVCSLTVVVESWVNPYYLISKKCIEFAYKIDTEIDLDIYTYTAEVEGIPYCYKADKDETASN